MIFSGLAGGTVAFIPGMSVSTVLILMGVYYQLITSAKAVMSMEFTYLLPLGLFVVSAVVGLVLASNIIKHAFEKFPGGANTMVFGFMLGSFIGIFIQSLYIDDVSFNWLMGSVAVLLGLGSAMIFVVMGKKFNQ
jgi:putative membrane protein